MFKKVKVNFLEDLQTFMGVSARHSHKVITEAMKAFFSHEKNLLDAASCCHSILEDLTFKCLCPQVPREIILTFLKILIKNKPKIIGLLDQKAGDKLLDHIPQQYLVDIIELFNIKLSKKE